MRKVTFGGACTLDNFIAREDGAVDWLLWSDDVTEIMSDYWPKVDCIVMGRKTYEIAIENSKNDDKNPYGDISSFVFSRTLPQGSVNGVEIVNSDPAAFVTDLKNKDGKDICVMGGGQLGHNLLEAGVIDEIGLNIHPVLLGSGIPLFHNMSRQINLELISSRQLKSGCVYVLYSVNLG